MINHGRPEPFVSTLGIVVGRGPFFYCRINEEYELEYPQYYLIWSWK